jgi:protein-disulfide isomerase
MRKKSSEGESVEEKNNNFVPQQSYQRPPLFNNNLMVLLLIGISFFAGYLYFKVQTLEKNGANAVAAQPGDANQPPPQPTQNLEAMPKVTDKDHIRGSKDADVVLVEYSDLECPFCKNFHGTMQQVMKEYGDTVAWVYRNYPLGFHQNAQKEAEAAECAAQLGGNDAFWKYTDTIFERTTSNGTGFALDALVPLAEELGLNGSQFKECLDSGKYAQHVKDDMAGGTKTGISGTPGTVIVAKNGKKDFVGGAYPFDAVKAQIDALLK